MSLNGDAACVGPADRASATRNDLLIDTSGSMAGTSIEQAKAALLLALNRLTAQDRFNVIQFNSVTHVLFSQPQSVKTDTLRKRSITSSSFVPMEARKFFPP